MSDPATQVLVTQAMEAVGPTVTEFASGVVGQPGQQVGGLIADKLAYMRWKSGVKMLARAERFAAKQGVPVNRVPLKNFLPLLEGASLEEETDDDMIDRWAHLLVRNMDPAATPPGWADILRQISPLEARALDWIYDVTVLMPVYVWDHNGARTRRLAQELTITEGEAGLACDTLGRLGLVQTPGVNDSRPDFAMAVSLTRLGYWFVNACRAPERHAVPPFDLSDDLKVQLQQRTHPLLTPGGVYPGDKGGQRVNARISFGLPVAEVTVTPPE